MQNKLSNTYVNKDGELKSDYAPFDEGSVLVVVLALVVIAIVIM